MEADKTFQDDPSISDEENLFRRINPSWTDWDENGEPIILSAAFKSRNGDLSVCIETAMVQDGRAPADALRLYPHCGLAAISAGLARSLGQVVARDPVPEEPAHGVVYGNQQRNRVYSKLCAGARWMIVTPRT